MRFRSPTARRRHHRMRTCVAAVAGTLLVGGVAATAWPAHAVGEIADAAITQRITGSLASGTTALITVTVTNNGPDSIFEAIVPGGAPTGATLNTVTPSQGACAKGRNTVYTCNFGSMAPGTTARATVSVTLGAPGPATAQASVSPSGASDPDLSNNVSRLAIVVGAPAVDIQLNGSSSTKAPDAGASVELRYQVRVNGKFATDGNVLAVALPSDVAYLASSTTTGAGCTPTATGLLCDLASIPAGGQSNVTISLVAPSTVGTTTSIVATASHAAADANLSNNTSTLTLTTR